MKSVSGALILSVGLIAAGCADDVSERVRTVGQDVCESEKQWVGGEDGSPQMKPGGNCIRCHVDNSGAPEFLFAGTVYASAEAEDDCFGVEGATVVVSDESGARVEMPTNAAGNFYVEPERAPGLSPPYSAKVVYEGREQVMTEPLYSANCVDCHDGSDTGRIPPRIVIPRAE